MGGQGRAGRRAIPLATQAPNSWFGSLILEQGDASGLHYRRARYYDPASGRFTQEDPIGLAGGLNLYGFANGDPVNFSDPFGLTPALLLRLWTWIASNWRAITTAIGIGRTAGWAAQSPVGQEAIGAAAGPAVSASDAIGRGLVSTGGHLARLLPAIEAAAKLNPSSAMDALGVISQATRSVGLEPGMITQLANGSIQIVSRGGITTSLGSSGSILIERGKDVLLNIPK